MINNRAGKFIKIGKGQSEYSCFVPSPLPLQNENDIKYDSEMIYLISEANRHIGRLDEVTDFLIAPNYFVYMYAKKEATLSSQIEGTKATFSDLIKAEAGMEDEVPNDVKEIENYIKAIQYGFERIKTLPLSLRLIREIHSILMSGVRGEHKTPGEFRTSQNWIGGYSINSASYIPPGVEYLGACLDNFERFMHEEDKISPLIKAALLHSHFEMIHPFLDGNGRLGRLLITLYLSVNNILHRPTLYLSKYFKKHRSVYYDLLSNIHQKGQYEEFIKFFLTGIIETSKEAVEIARNITELKNSDIKKISTFGRLSESALTIYEGLFSKPTIRIEDVSKSLNVSVSTAGRLLGKLASEDILKNLDNKKKDKVFVYQKYIDIFNQE